MILPSASTVVVQYLFRSSRPGVLCKKGILRKVAKFTEKHLCQSLFFYSMFEKLYYCETEIDFIQIVDLILATSKTWTRTLDPDSGPWTQTLKNLDPEKHGKQLDMEK